MTGDLLRFLCKDPINVGANPTYNTDFELQAAIEEAHSLQNWLFEEDRASVDLTWDAENSGDEDEPPEAPFEVSKEVPSATQDPSSPGTMAGDLQGRFGPSRMAKRRKRQRGESGTTRPSKRLRLADGRARKAGSQAVRTSIDMRTLDTGKRSVVCDPKVYTLAELREEGFAVLSWDGL